METIKTRRKDHKSPEAHAKVAAAIAKGVPIQTALLEAGYSKNTAKQGRAALSQPILAAIMAQGVKFAKVGKKLDAATVTDSIKGKLYTAMVTGQEKGINAAKMLGNMKDYSVFTADNQVGLIVIQPPAGMMNELTQRLSVPLLEAECVTNTSDKVTDPDPT